MLFCDNGSRHILAKAEALLKKDGKEKKKKNATRRKERNRILGAEKDERNEVIKAFLASGI